MQSPTVNRPLYDPHLQGSDPWIRAIHICFLAAMTVVLLFFPLSIKTEWVDAAQRFLSSIPGGKPVFGIFEPIVKYQYSPVSMKEIPTCWFFLIMFALWATRAAVRMERPRGLTRMEAIVFLSFAGWVLLSAVWSPILTISPDCLETVLSFFAWASAFFVLTTLPLSKKFHNKSWALLLILGFIIMAISIGEALRGVSDYVFMFLCKVEDTVMKRNLYGSLLGHNTAVGEVSLQLFFLSFGALLTMRKWRYRAVMGIYVAITLFTVFIAQSRNVWIQSVVFIPPFLIGLSYILGYRIRLKYYLCGIALLAMFIAAQAFPFRGNILYLPDGLFMDRLKCLTPKILATGTQARILINTLPMIASSPIWGHGLASFPFLFPEVQAQYFAEHPNTWLYPTVFITQQAHNDFLQLLIETGGVGLILCIVSWLFIVRRGYIRFKNTQDPTDRIRRYCCFFALATATLHTSGDFPMHLPMLAFLYVYYAAMWFGSPSDDMNVNETQNRVRVVSAFYKPMKYGLLALVAILWIALPYPIVWTSRLLIANFKFNAGMQTFSLFQTESSDRSPENIPHLKQYMEEARATFQQSVQVYPKKNLPRYQMGMCDYHLATLLWDEENSALASNDMAKAIGIRDQAIRCLVNAIDIIEESSYMKQSVKSGGPARRLDLPGLRVHHGVFYVLAHSFIQLHRMGVLPEELPDDFKLKEFGTTNPDKLAIARAALDNFKQAARYSPATTSIIVDLIDFGNYTDLLGRTETMYYLSMLAKWNSNEMVDTYDKRANRLIEQGKYRAAINDLALLLAALRDPNEYPEIQGRLANAIIRYGNVEKLDEFLKDLEKRNPKHPDLPMIRLIDAIFHSDYATANRLFDVMKTNKTLSNQYLRCIEAELLSHSGNATSGDTLFHQLINEVPSPASCYATRAFICQFYFRDIDRSLRDYAKAVSCYPAPDVPIFLMYLRSLDERGDTDQFKKVRAIAQRIYPDSILLKEMDDDIQAQESASSKP
jgi:tetratricopeptide (TPR) repeat protein